MNKKALAAAALALSLLVAGCSQNTGTTNPSSSANGQPEASATPKPTKKPNKKWEEAQNLALDHVNIYINGDDVAEKQKYVEKSVNPEVASLFLLGAASIRKEEEKFKNPFVAETVDFTGDNGAKGTLTLIKAEGDREIIVLVMDAKVTFAFFNENNNEEMQENYEKMRANFKN
ncbi:hypothetical protein [Paenibacillus paeoniae]|uniref:Lipoprotein n=1 Tax=Paenibacillus paeoniae TaxID=2292705 RepID=A0A371PJT7_9BACL|nr:hypothetical protein [Paenibacillus paeoniae]REK76456.1 hypothetical protein DX130_05290 [Paenibacillus paeoniae]